MEARRRRRHESRTIWRTPVLDKKAERLCLALLVAVLDGECEERAPEVFNGVPRFVIADAIHKLAHVFVGAYHPHERPKARDDFHRRLVELTESQR